MNANMAEFQALLAQLRNAFLEELPERCTAFETLILRLESTPTDRESFSELFRGVHSLKGSGGTHGLDLVTTLCHQLENVLASGDFGTGFADAALAYVDLLRRVPAAGTRDTPDFSKIEADLNALRQAALQQRKAGLIVESSAIQAELYQQTLAALPVQLTVINDGLAALELLLQEPFDFVILGWELKRLNGIAMLAALRASQTHNSDIPALLITSRRDAVPAHAGVRAVIARDRHMTDRLVDTVRTLKASSR